jgi:hypothetical protein
MQAVSGCRLEKRAQTGSCLGLMWSFDTHLMIWFRQPSAFAQPNILKPTTLRQARSCSRRQRQAMLDLFTKISLETLTARG